MSIRRFLVLCTIPWLAVAIATPALAQVNGVPDIVEPEFVEPAPPPPAPVQQQPLGVGFAAREHYSQASVFVGGLVGGDLASLTRDGFSLSSTLENGRAYGGRLGYYTFPFGVEGSFSYSDNGLGISASVDDVTFSLGAKVIYLEANVLLSILPGPVRPFVTGGGGFHSYEFVDFAGIKAQQWGWNFGGGIMIDIKRFVVRADIRDHLTRITAADLNIDEDLIKLLDIGTQSLHNAELSVGVGFKF